MINATVCTAFAVHLMRIHQQQWGIEDDRQGQRDDQQVHSSHSTLASTADSTAATMITAVDAITIGSTTAIDAAPYPFHQQSTLNEL